MSSTQEVDFVGNKRNPVRSQGLLLCFEPVTCSRKERMEAHSVPATSSSRSPSCSPLGSCASSPEPATLQVPILGSAWNISHPPFSLWVPEMHSFLGMDSILSVTPKHQFVALSTILESSEGIPSVSWLLPFDSWQLSSCQFSPG